MSRFLSLCLATLWIAADLFSKNWALKNLADSYMTITPWMNLRLAFNKGAAFSFLATESGWQLWLFSGLAVAVSLWLLWSLLFDKTDGLTRLGYASILGGALGNLYDRLVHGHVIDFIQWHYRGKSWPIFNIADVAITVGVIAMLLAVLISARGSSRLLD